MKGETLELLVAVEIRQKKKGLLGSVGSWGSTGDVYIAILQQLSLGLLVNTPHALQMKIYAFFCMEEGEEVEASAFCKNQTRVITVEESSYSIS